MNKNKIFGIFILFALLITCIGVSFASDDIDNTFIDDTSDEHVDIDELEINDDSDIGDDDFEDEDIDDEDFEDDDEDIDYDDDDIDDEDFEDDDEDIDYDDDDIDDEDFEDEISYTKSGNYTEDGKLYFYEYVFYKSGTAIGCAYMADRSFDDESDENESEIAYKTPDENSCDESSSDTNISKKSSENNELISENINFKNLKNSIITNSTNSTDEDIVNHTSFVKTADNELGILALLAFLIVSILVII